jgi:chorismate synthase
MMNSFGHIFRITTFGESHGKAVGVILDGCPAGYEISEADIQPDLDRRRPGQSKITTARDEADQIEIFSGVFEGKTTGHPIMMMVRNKDQRSKDYGDIKDKFRPSHADFTYQMKYGIRDYRGGGRSSARETIARVAAGAIAKKILMQETKANIIGHVVQVGDIKATQFKPETIEQNPVRCADPEAAIAMERKIHQVKAKMDSIGGIAEVRVLNTPSSLGNPTFGKIKADLASAIMSLPGVKGFEYGTGFATAEMTGTEHNDEFYIDVEGNTRTKTNHHGGILGGITTGEDLVLRMVLKPTSSIPKKQQTVDKHGNETEIETYGRHDPCLCPRLVPMAEAMVALVLMDHWLLNKTVR